MRSRKYLKLLLAAISSLPAAGQSFFSAREFLFNLPFQMGRDVSPESTGIPMALSASGAYIAASFQSSGLAFQGFLRKYDSSGKEVWTRQITGADTPSMMAADATSVYVAGSLGFSRSEMFVLKYDAAGNEVWSRQLRVSDGGYHLAGGMVIDASGLYVAAWDGRTQGLVRKYSAAGDELWSRSITVRSLRGLSVSDAVYVSAVNDQGGFLVKLSAGGDTIWTHQLDSSPTETVVPSGVVADSSGVYVAGSIYRRLRPGDITFEPSTAEGFLRKLDAGGTEVWARRFPAVHPNSIASVAVDQSGIYVGGSTQHALPGQCSAGGSDVFLRKYDLAGLEQWTRQFGTSGYDFPGNLAMDSTGVYFSGGVRGSTQAGAYLVKLPKSQSPPVDTKPSISWECVVNSASYAGGGVAPGEIVTIFGRAMGPTDLVTFRLGADGRLTTDLSETRVLFNGVAAPLLYVSARQIGTIVPNSLAANSTVSVEVEYLGVRSAPLTLPVASSRAGIFALDGSGAGPGAILNQDGTVNSPANPAAKGSVISVYIAGAGLTDPASADGSILQGTPPLLKQPVQILFDDPFELGTISPAEVLYAGGVAQSVAGLVQVNVRVPDWVTAGGSVPIYLQVLNDPAEAGVTVAVR